MKSNVLNMPTAVPPKTQPPATSWWIEPQDREAFTERQRLEQARMSSSADTTNYQRAQSTLDT